MMEFIEKHKKAITAIIIAVASMFGIALSALGCIGNEPQYSGSLSGSVGFGSDDSFAPVENMELLPLQYGTAYTLEDGRVLVITETGSVTFPAQPKKGNKK